LSSTALVLLALLFIASAAVPANGQAYAETITCAKNYLLQHFVPEIGLVYESDDSGRHWLNTELPGFHWKYDQTFWLYSDNLFAYLALKRGHPEIASVIHETINRFGQPAPLLFEVVAGERIPLPMRNAHDYIVAEDDRFVVMIRRHNASSLAFGEYVDFWMYEALERALEGDLGTAVFLVHQAERLWRGDGLWDWSYTIHDHTFSNQKLALLLLTAHALGINLEHEQEMEAHLWSMQNADGGIASLSDSSGRKLGSSNAETTALTVLVYDGATLAKFPKSNFPSIYDDSFLIGILIVAILFASLGFYAHRSHLKRERMLS